MIIRRSLIFWSNRQDQNTTGSCSPLQFCYPEIDSVYVICGARSERPGKWHCARKGLSALDIPTLWVTAARLRKPPHPKQDQQQHQTQPNHGQALFPIPPRLHTIAECDFHKAALF
jgi:hypothetical protein